MARQISTVGLRSERGPILLAVMLSTGLVAIDATILATAVPTIVEDLGGFSQFPWLFSAYLLAQAVAVPLYAKLADTVGRKPLMLFGIGMFLLGSILCGLAWSMPALILFRVVQGLGAGAVQPIAMTIIGDIYTLEERARTQGYVASVWAVSSVIGPTLGGIFAQYLTWQWIFFVNIPLCLLAGWLIVRNFHEQLEKRAHRIDVLGAVLLTASVSLIILGLLQGGTSWAWDSATSIAVFAGGAVLLGAFVLAERRASEPILPLWVLSRRLLLTTSLLALGVGALLTGLTTYVPTYLEGSIGVEPLYAGFALAALTLGWPIAATLSGRLYLRLGFRTTILIGFGFAVVGAGLLAGFASQPSVALVATACFVMGLGMGLIASPSLIAAQSSVDWDERGVVTGTNMFARSLGSAVGVAVFGAMVNTVVAANGGDETDPAVITEASALVFVGVLILVVVSIAAALAMTKDKPLPATAIDVTDLPAV